MQSRFAIVVTSVAGAALLFGCGVMFGLGVLLSPPANMQRQEPAFASASSPVRRETTGVATQEDDRSLTPIYPTRIPGTEPAAGQDTQTAQKSPPAVQGQSQPPQQAAQPVAQHAKAEPAAPEPERTPAAAAAAPKPNATPVSLEKRNACDVDACAHAYRSFRAEDCTYQPYSGPRQLCVNPPRETQASRDTVRPARVSHERRARELRGDDLDAVAREVKRLTGGAGRPVEVIDGGVAVIEDDQ
jgi:hypothetical protein